VRSPSPSTSSQANQHVNEVQANPNARQPATSIRQAVQSGQDSTTLMLHCLFAMVFAAATLGLLNCLGLFVRSGPCCPPSDGYSRCEVWQDMRSGLSFILGALLCCLVSRERKQPANANGHEPEVASKVQLYACLL